MNQNNRLGVITINGKFRVLGYFRAGFSFLWMGIKETFKQAMKFEKATSDLYYAVNAKLDIKQINKVA